MSKSTPISNLPNLKKQSGPAFEQRENEIVKDDCSLCDLLDIDNTINFEIKAKAGANIKTKQ